MFDFSKTNNLDFKTLNARSPNLKHKMTKNVLCVWLCLPGEYSLNNVELFKTFFLNIPKSINQFALFKWQDINDLIKICKQKACKKINK